MKLSRHNYEEYFILYADKELSSDDRRMVEEFVLLNPDLKDELDIYNNTVLSIEPSIEFENKEELHHHDETLISYLDNELPAEEKLELERLISSSPKLQNELDLYRKTKLQPDTDTVFEDKSVLYRSTERRRVVSMTIIRWSMAAAILLAVSITAVNLLNNKSNNATAGLEPKKTPTETAKNSVTNNPVNNQATSIENKDPKDQITIPQSNKNTLAQSITKQKQVKEKKIDITPVEEKQKEVIALNDSKTNNLPTPQNNPNIDNFPSRKTEDPTSVNGSQNDNNSVTSGNQQPLDNGKQAESENKTEPQFASLTSEEGGQNKRSRGFFRKLTRVFEKNTGIKATDDDEKLHIAAFTVKLK